MADLLQGKQSWQENEGSLKVFCTKSFMVYGYVKGKYSERAFKIAKKLMILKVKHFKEKQL